MDQTLLDDGVLPPTTTPSSNSSNSFENTGLLAGRRKPLKILYALGPGDVVQGYRDLLEHTEAPFEMSISFSKLFVDWCNSAGTQAHLISWNTRKDSLRHGRHYVENLPRSPWYYKYGVKYHIASATYGLKIIARALRGRASVVVVDSGTTHWILLSLLSLFSIPVIAVMHSTLWPKGSPPTRRIDRIIRTLDGIFFRRFAAATVCVSPECERQVRQVAGVTKGPVYQCRAQFDPSAMATVKPVPGKDVRPFRVLFVGRVDRFKGVFLIVSMAERLEQELPGQFSWKIIGSGPASESLAREVANRNMRHVIDVAGRLPREEVLAAHSWSHAMIVPTVGAYNEGLAMTAAEGVLAGRPVVLSEMVPAWEVLGDAAIRVETGNVEGFVEVFKKLAGDTAYYDHCREATKDVQDQFYQTSQGLGAMIGTAIIDLNQSKSQATNKQIA
jgi:glycogen(starch) synthase